MSPRQFPSRTTVVAAQIELLYRGASEAYVVTI